MSADPVLSGNVYASGKLDAVLYDGLHPCWLQLHAREDTSYLWLARSGRNGEHWKVRLHGQKDLAPVAREVFESVLLPVLAGLPEQEGPRRVAATEPPVDVEDAAESIPPDRHLLWTTYRRSHVTLGGGPLLQDDTFADLATRCLAAGTERVFGLFATHGGQPPHSARQRTLLSALLEAVAALRFHEEDLHAYLVFHRDWLVRFPWMHAENGTEGARRALAVLDGRAELLGGVIAKLRSRLDAGSESSEWGKHLRDLASYVVRFQGDPAYDHDPFTFGPLRPSFFKVLHNLANQLGLSMPDEAFAYHLAVRAVAPDSPRRLEIDLNRP